MLSCKRKPQSQVFRHAAETDDTFPRILTDTVSVKTDGDLDAGSAHDVLLFFVFKNTNAHKAKCPVGDSLLSSFAVSHPFWRRKATEYLIFRGLP